MYTQQKQTQTQTQNVNNNQSRIIPSSFSFQSSQSNNKVYKPIPLKEMELFLFTIPSKEKTLMLTDLDENTTKKDIEIAFSRFGLIYDIVVYTNKNSKRILGLIKYCLENSAISALNHHHTIEKIKINGRECTSVVLSSFKSDKPFEIPFPKSLQIINHLLGFNQWSTEIDRFEHEYTREILLETDLNGVPLQTPIRKYESKWYALVYSTFKQIDVRISTVSHGVGEDSCKIEATRNAKKVAVSNSRKLAFTKIGILIIKDQSPIPCILDQDSIVDSSSNNFNSDCNQYMFDNNLIQNDENEQQQEEEEEQQQQEEFDENEFQNNDIDFDFDTNDSNPTDLDVDVDVDIDTDVDFSSDIKIDDSNVDAGVDIDVDISIP
ncbi:hypothetical protein DDB_G0283733 [Dictyostelium discoideum AX4]|uniref:RRM domain-containing protein n=1 Tax=Dictyostelium discoideum TaxID=44689 RepID=Q54QN3_DICDI|nr:hypothetical protein DDB_G0283733 [Dictyostelium discoideum AX4]EAL65633.1 hypothetical protein DDB_G0283733 [Dictyostelium discoideum AX4]|eukprot:XP_638990.1 hypothetical protein DDB_G0283733 [Dictyostelium discoideum AX4]